MNNEYIAHQQAVHELLNNSVINAGRSIIILSGVAAITLMSQIPAIPELIGAIIWFIWGTVFGSLFFVFTYFTQYYTSTVSTCYNKYQDYSIESGKMKWCRRVTIVLFVIGDRKSVV